MDSFVGFVSWFVGGLLITATMQVLFDNVFLTAFVVACIMGVLGAKE